MCVWCHALYLGVRFSEVEGMAGPFVLTSAIAGFGVLVHLTKAQIDKRRRGRKSQREKSQREKMNPEVGSCRALPVFVFGWLFSS